MIAQQTRLLSLLDATKEIPTVRAPTSGRGRPQVYPDDLFLKAVVVMVVRRLNTVHEFWTMLQEPTPEMEQLRAALSQEGKFPTRRTWERRLKTLPATLSERIGLFGGTLYRRLRRYFCHGPAAAIDSSILHAYGGKWHQKDRQQGLVPHTSIDTEAHWTKSGWHGWVYGWKMHLITTAGADLWLPLAAALTPAHHADNKVAVQLIDQLPPEITLLLGDTAYQDGALRAQCSLQDRVLVAPHRRKCHKDDPGRPVRKVLHELRSRAIENLNGQIKSIFNLKAPVPTRGEINTSRHVLGALLVYQLALSVCDRQGKSLRSGLKAFLRAA